MGIIDTNFRNILLDEKKDTKIFQFMTFHTKLLLWAQYHCALGSMEQMNF